MSELERYGFAPPLVSEDEPLTAFEREILSPPEDVGEEEERAAARARALRESPVYREIYTEMRASVLATFEATPLRDEQGLLYCRLMLKVLEDFDTILKDKADTGTMAELVRAGQDSFKA